MADEKRRIRDWTNEASVQDITGKDIYFAADHSLFATGKKILLSVFRQIAGIVNLETQLSQLLYSSNYVVDTYVDMIAITGMTNGQIAYVKDNAEYYIYSTADSAWLSPVGGDSITQSASTKIQRDVVSSYVLYKEQPIKSNVINSGSSDKTFTLVDYILADNEVEAFEFQMSGSGEPVELNLIELELNGRVLFSKTNQVVKTNTPTLFTIPKSDIFFADDVALRIVMNTQFNIDGDSSGDIYYRLYESVELVSTRLEAQESFFDVEIEPIAASTLANPSVGTDILFKNSENNNHYTIRRSDGSNSDLEGSGGGDLSYNEWTTIDHTILSKGSDTTILVTGADWTFMLGGALGLNVTYGTHIVKGAVFAGGNTTLTIVGAGVVPASITSAVFANQTRVKKIPLIFNYGTFNSGDTTNVLEVYGNKPYRYSGQPARLLHFWTYSSNYGTVGSGSINANIDGGSALFSSSILLSAASGGELNSGTIIQNNILNGDNNDVRFTNPVAKGSDDGETIQSYIEITLD